MIKPTTRFSDLPWYGPTLDLAGSYPWKGNVNKIEAVRANGNGFDTNTTAAFASLNTLVAGKTYRLDLKNIPAGGVEIDNGTPPTSGSSDFDIYDVPAGTATAAITFVEPLNFFGVQFGPPVLTNAATGAVVAGTVRFQLDQGQLMDYQAFNAAMAGIPESECANSTHQYFLSVSVTSDVAATLSIQLF